MSKELLTTQQFAQHSGLAASTISSWLRSGKLQGVKQGRRWMIPADQLALLHSSVQEPAAKKELSSVAAEALPSEASSYSIAEFAAMTYLTELGVQRWLQEKRLEGFRQPNGEWRIYASNLSNSKVTHLLRK